MGEPKFLERARETYKFHRLKLLVEDGWTSIKTAKALRRSIGSISEDLLIARWGKTHEIQLQKFKYAYEALEFIREKLKQQNSEDIE